LLHLFSTSLGTGRLSGHVRIDGGYWRISGLTVRCRPDTPLTDPYEFDILLSDEIRSIKAARVHHAAWRRSGVEGAMTATQYSLLAVLIFALVAVLQFLRAISGLPITIGRTSIPIWASWVACGVAIVLAWLGYAASQG
jgi:hypothetical protein